MGDFERWIMGDFESPYTSEYIGVGPWSGTAADYDVLVVLYPYADRTTYANWLRYSATPRSVSVDLPSSVTGYQQVNGIYPARATIGRLSESIGVAPIPEIILSEFTVQISRDGTGTATDDLLALINRHWDDANGWTLRVYANAPNTALSPTGDLIYEGTLDSEAFKIEPRVITLRAANLLKKYDVEFPTRVYGDDFGNDTYTAWGRGGEIIKVTGPYNPLDDAIQEDIMPVVYGDWTDPPSNYWLPCGIIRKTIGSKYGTPGTALAELGVLVCKSNSEADGHGRGIYSAPERFKWIKSDGSRHGGAGRGSKFYPSTNSVNPAGTSHSVISYLDDSDNSHVDYYDGDRVYAKNAKGNYRASVELIEEPAGIIYDLLTDPYFGNVPAAYIDDSLDPTKRTFVTTGLKFRSRINEKRRLISDHIAEICRDAGLIFYVKNGKFAVQRNKLWTWEAYGVNVDVHTVDRIRHLDTAKHNVRLKEYEYNGVRVRYRWNPSTESYGGLWQDGLKTDYNEPREPYLEVESKWIYRHVDARAFGGTLLKIVQSRGRVVEFDLPIAGLDFSIGDRISFTGDGFHGGIFYTVSVDKDFRSGVATIKGVRMALRFYGAQVAPDGTPGYSDPSTTLADKKLYGWATDADGCIAPDTTEYSHVIEW